MGHDPRFVPEIPRAEAADRPTPALASALERIIGVCTGEPGEAAARRIAGACAEIIPCADAAAVLARDGERLEVVAAVGLDGEPPAPGPRALELARPGDPRIAVDPGPPLPEGTRAACAVPFAAGGMEGALLVGSRTADAFGEEDVLLARAAAHAAALHLAAARLARERDDARAVARRAIEEVEARRSAVDQILGIVGHDLRNPLGAIHMSAALLQKKGGLAGWQARTVERVRSSAGRMGRIIADLLSYTRTRLGTGIPIERKPSRLDEICQRVVDELGAANPDRAIEIDVHGDVSGELDPDRLEQVASNLISNAVDHGDPALPVRVVLADEGPRVRLEVVNRGEPVPLEVLEHLFEPFARGPEAKSRKASGLGLGLYISREIVKGHGGEISVATGAETTIIVRLPRRPW
jgi:signal transduction histidine kinase